MRGELNRSGWTGGKDLSGELHIYSTTTKEQTALYLIFSRSHTVNDLNQEVTITISEPWKEPFVVQHPDFRAVKCELAKRGALPFSRIAREGNRVLRKALQEAKKV